MDKAAKKRYREDIGSRFRKLILGEEMNIKEKLQNYRRVLTIASKPSKDDFISTARICAIGIIIIGVIGFMLYLIALMLPQIFG